ncbi:MAG: tetratricopeptide repeat protein [Chthonomonas sp.]|nr:tetratricopeptide repeat protein [Chthonomonas sp.]
MRSNPYALFFGLLVLGACAPAAPEGPPAIASESEYRAAQQEAKTLSLDALKQFRDGVMLDEVQKNGLIRAGQLFDRMIAYDPKQPGHYLGAIKANLAVEDDAGAIKYFEAARKVCEGANDRVSLAELYGDMGLAHYGQGNYGKALEFIEEARTLEPQNVDYLTSELMVRLETREPERVNELVAEAKKIPVHPPRLDKLIKLVAMSKSEDDKSP